MPALPIAICPSAARVRFRETSSARAKKNRCRCDSGSFAFGGGRSDTGGTSGGPYDCRRPTSSRHFNCPI